MTQEPKTAAGLPILVVDDDITFLSFVTAALTRHGRTYEVAITGGQALAMLRNTKVRAVLLDRKLPDRDGVDVLREIVKDPEHAPVILVSGAASIESAREAGYLGAVGYLEKPVRIAELLAVLDQVSDSSQRKIDFLGPNTNRKPPSSFAFLAATDRLAEVVLRASLQSVDFKNAQGLAKAVNVGYGTMRHWCRNADISGRAFVRFARGFWATRHALRAVRPPIEILDCLEIETSERILDTTARLETVVEAYCTHQKHLPASHPVVLACLTQLLRSDPSTDTCVTAPTIGHQKNPNPRVRPER
jgi:DNA-binding response OmpR family regulator